MTAEIVPVRFEDVDLAVRPNVDHEWLLTTAEAAAGLGVSESSVYMTKTRRATELVEGRHFITVADLSTSDGTLTIREGGPARTLWTKRGVVRLGFWARSARAKRFRDWAEDLIVQSDTSTPGTAVALPDMTALAKADPNAALAIGQALAGLAQANLELEAKVIEAEPKVAAYDELVASDGLLDMTSLANTLGMGVRAMTTWLVDEGIFRRQVSAENTRNLPRDRYQPECFVVKTETNGYATYPVVYATGAGLDLVVRLRRRGTELCLAGSRTP